MIFNGRKDKITRVTEKERDVLEIASKTGYFERCFLVNPSTSANKMSGRRRVMLMTRYLV